LLLKVHSIDQQHPQSVVAISGSEPSL
jgi:hypothetical protein